MYYGNHYKLGLRRDYLVKPDNYILTVPAVSPAIDLESIKDHIRSIQGFDDYDSQLLSLIKVVTQYGEKVTGRDFINKTYQGFLDCFPACEWQSIQIRKSRLQSVSSIQYYKNGVLTTFDASKYYFTESEEFSTIQLVDGETWPTDIDKRKQAVIITFVAGYGDDSCDIPALLRQAMLSHLTVLFENSGDCMDDEGGSDSQFLSLYKPFILSTKLVCPI